MCVTLVLMQGRSHGATEEVVLNRINVRSARCACAQVPSCTHTLCTLNALAVA